MKIRNQSEKIATALKYESESGNAPRVIAKGIGYVAESILKKGEESNVPVYEDEKLSRQLYNLSVGEEIPEEMYEIVAEVLIFIAKLDSRKL